MRTYLATSRSGTPLLPELNGKLAPHAPGGDISIISAPRDLPSLLKFALLFDPRAIQQTYGPVLGLGDEVTR
jgi:hypothetical protein